MRPSESKHEMIRRLKKGGDEEAARLLVQRYGPRLLAAATLLCGNPDDAQDLMIETLQRAVRGIGGFRERSSLFSWLYGILFNLSRMMWRKRSRSRLIYTDTLPEVAAQDPEAGSALDASLNAQCLAAAIRQLAEPLQQTVLLRYYGELSVAEIAEALEIPPGTVKSRLFSANARLRELLPPELHP